MLEEVLADVEAERQSAEAELSEGTVERRQELAVRVELDRPVSTLSVELTKSCSARELEGKFLPGWDAVLATFEGIIEVFWVETNAQRAIPFQHVGEGRDPVGRVGDRSDDTQFDHPVEFGPDFVSQVDWGSTRGVFHRGDAWICH